jgi:outer membrane protein assembly factor BamB
LAAAPNRVLVQAGSCRSPDGQLFAFDTGGHRVWDTTTSTAGVLFSRRPLGTGDQVIVVRHDAEVRGLDTRTGKPRWEAAGPSPDAGDGQPLSADTPDLVLLAGTASPMPTPDGIGPPVRSSPGELRALNRATGRQTWQTELAVTAIYDITQQGDAVVALVRPNAQSPGLPDFQLVALDLADGHERWRVDLGQTERFGPIVAAGGVVVFQASEPPRGANEFASRLSGFDAMTGAALWEKHDVASPDMNLVGYANRLYRTDPSGTLLALDARTGKTRWTQSVPKPAQANTLLGVGGRIALVQNRQSHTLFAYDTRTGHLRWSAKTQISIGLPTTKAIYAAGGSNSGKCGD